MKKTHWILLFLFLPIWGFAQQTKSTIDTNAINAQWTEVDRLISIKNYEQTLPILANIKAIALRHEDKATWLRAFMAEARVAQINSTNDETFEKIEKLFERNIEHEKPIVKDILYNFYASYLLSNRHRFLTNSKSSFILKDIKGKNQTIDSLFRLSLAHQDLLKKEKTENWKAMFSSTDNLSLSPTLFHYLGYSYLSFLKDNTEDSTSFLSLSEKMEQFNQEYKFSNANTYLAVFKLDRNYRGYLETIAEYRRIIKAYPSDYNVFLLNEIASLYFNNQKPVEALKVIEEARNNYPKSPWLNNIELTYNQIKSVYINTTYKDIIPAQAYSPIKFRVRNVDRLYIKVYNTTNNPKSTQFFKVKYDSLTNITSLNAPLAYEESFALKHFDDANQHNSIYKINPLNYGHYTLLISNNPEFKDDGLFNEVEVSSFYVSDVYISARHSMEEDDFDEYLGLIINRKTGEPYANKSLKFYDFYEKMPLKLAHKLKTDAKGQFRFRTNDKKEITDLDDYQLYLADEDQFIDLSNLDQWGSLLEEEVDAEDQEGNTELLSFLDRAIYRPGQPLYFKGVVYNNHYQRGKVLPGKKIQVALFDANNRKIDSLYLTSNEYGSVNGEFKLPKTTLAGNFYLQFHQDKEQIGMAYFRVEEYKRPTFEVKWETNKETYTLQDTAHFEGTANSLNGAPLTNATVKYKVQLFSYQGKRINRIFMDSTTVVNEQGKFEIKIPLMDTLFKDLSDFSLSYSAEVISQNGEMQSANGSYQFSKKPWRINVNSPTLLEEKHWSSIEINTTNQNNQPLKFAGEVSIYKIKPNTVILPASNGGYFQSAEYHLFSNEEYKKYFPKLFDENELKKDNKELIKTYAFNTNDTSLVKIDSNLFTAGAYEIKAISIQGKDTITGIGYTSLYQKENHKISQSQFLTYSLNKAAYSVNDQVKISLFTDIKDARKLYLFKTIGSKLQPLEVLNWKDGQIDYNLTLTKDLVNNNLSITVMLVVDNKMEWKSIHLPLIRDEKSLTIQTQTFRDKITPGQKEKWSFTINQKDQKIQSEVLATMYDAALDQFASNQFANGFQVNYPYFPSPSYYYLDGSFNQTSSSYNLFGYQNLINYQDNGLPILRDYGLWNRGLVLRGQYGEGALEEVVVTGFGTKRKNSIVGSVSLQGRAAGLAVADLSNAAPEAILIRGTGSAANEGQTPLYVVDGEVMIGNDINSLVKPDDIESFSILKGPESTALYGARGANGVVVIRTKLGAKAEKDLVDVKVRTNLQETAFFFPNLHTDAEGNVTFEFDSPEALSKWKLLLFAHDKTLNAGSTTFFTQTQKQLMVRPNLPRYFREEDEITIKAQIQNMSKKALKGTAKIELINPETNALISSQFLQENAVTAFETTANEHGLVEWKLKIPAGISSVQVKIVAGNTEFSDGEMVEVPILTNKILITDSEKIVLKPSEQKDYLIKIAGKDHVQAKIQVQSNPILEIISALDYLKNYPYECTEQLTSKWFGLKVIEYLNQKYPAITDYFKKLNLEDNQSKLESNAELNAFKLEEMPWLRAIENDDKKLRELAILFRSDIQSELKTLEKKILKNQTKDGGFTWFDGGKSDPYMSIRILEILGKTLNLEKTLISKDMLQAVPKLTSYLDTSSAVFNPKASGTYALDYLYARRYWSEYYPISDKIKSSLKSKVALGPLLTANSAAGIAAKAWIVNLLYGTGKESTEIRNRLQQEVIQDELKGLYWESNDKYYNGISMQAYLVEAYKHYDPSKLKDISQWLFYKKTTNYWNSTWMTVDAIYAILLANNPADFALENTVTVQMNDKPLDMQNQVLGQVTQIISKDELNQDSRISIKNNNDRYIYGGIYHQYFSAAEDVRSAKNELSVAKVFLVERNGKWVETEEAKLGEKIKVKITVISDKNLEYVHLKDSRPSGVEPVFQPSGYKWWQGYYFTIKDASTNYFFDRYGKGKFSYEYEVKANNIGVFNSGLTTVECMYDPTVNARSANTVLTIIP